MRVRVQSVNFNARPELLEFIQKKLDKLDQVHDRIIEGEVFLKVDNSHDRMNKIAEIKINVPGNELMVKKNCETFEEAADLGAEALRKQLERHKGKLRGL